MLRVISATQRRKSLVIAKRCKSQRLICKGLALARTGMHGSKHACDKLVDSIAFLYKRHQRRDSAFVVGTTSEV